MKWTNKWRYIEELSKINYLGAKIAFKLSIWEARFGRL